MSPECVRSQENVADAKQTLLLTQLGVINTTVKVGSWRNTKSFSGNGHRFALTGRILWRLDLSVRLSADQRGCTMKAIAAFAGVLTVRACLFAAAVTLVPAAGHAVDGFDLPGSDYANFAASSAFVCRNTCGGDSRCQAWTWVKPGLQGPTGRCWLKHRVPALVRNDCCNSGSHENISARDLKAEDRTDRPGSDYANFVTDSWKNCESTCANDQKCAAWTYARAGLQGPRGHCWLKAGVPHPVDNPQTVSGVKFRRASVSIDPGTNQVPASQ
jgi:hypothetical protein